MVSIIKNAGEYERGYSDGYAEAQRNFLDTITFQDAYIHALERRISALKENAYEDSNQ